MSELTKKKCVPCEGGMLPMVGEEITKYSREVPDWDVARSVSETHRLHREFKFKDFKESIAFVKKVAEIAETERHHPDIFIFYNVVKLDLWTHEIGGLSENDFILAAKIDELAKSA